MIKVVNTAGKDNNVKTVGMFLRRVRNSKLVPRWKKTRRYVKPKSALVAKRKAVKTAIYKSKKALVDRLGKKVLLEMPNTKKIKA